MILKKGKSLCMQLYKKNNKVTLLFTKLAIITAITTFRGNMFDKN